MLAHVVSLLNQRHGYGLDLLLLSIDEGISGYRDDSLETVKRNEAFYGIPLKILSYKGERRVQQQARAGRDIRRLKRVRKHGRGRQGYVHAVGLAGQADLHHACRAVRLDHGRNSGENRP